MSALPPDVSRFSGELRIKEGTDFERGVLPFLRLIWPAAQIPKHLGSLDRAGIDILVWADASPHPVVIQCKGFELTENSIGQKQVRQAIDSIDSFDESGIQAARFILLHSRGEKSEAFRQKVDSRLNRLVESGRIACAERWDIAKLLRESFESMVARVRNLCSLGLLGSGADSVARRNDEVDNIDCVPLRVSQIIANQWQLKSDTSPRTQVCDPCSEMFDANGPFKTLFILGGAGYGKTTLTQRFTRNHQNVIYVRASELSEYAVTRKNLLAECVNVERILREVPNDDSGIARVFAVSAVERTFRTDGSPALLILDGVDESVFFTRHGGIQTLLNSLRNIRIPVVLAMRSELYDSRKEDFQQSNGLRNPDSKPRSSRIRVLELLPWSNDEVRALAERHAECITGEERKRRITEFVELVRHGDYESYYGDIPKRPLFLRWILETVELYGVRHIGRAELFQLWAEAKIARDVDEPLLTGGTGRTRISESVDGKAETIRFSFEAMMAAAAAMTTTDDGELELLAECRFDQILNVSARMGRSLESVSALVLNSLLIPVPRRAPSDPQKVKFAHRVYQEFFLARFVLENPAFFGSVQLPESIEKWSSEIMEEAGPHGS